MTRGHGSRLWLCGGLMIGWCSLSCLAAGPVPAASPPAVDLAIEWVRQHRPPVLPLGSEMAAPTGADAALTALPDHGAAPQAWSLRTDDRRLSMALQRWCVLAGWQLVWEAERDFPVEVGIEVQGSWTSALEQVMKSLQDSDYPLQAVMNPQTRVLRVRRQLETLP